MSIGAAPFKGARLANYPLNTLVPSEGEPPCFIRGVGHKGRTIYCPNDSMRELQLWFAKVLIRITEKIPIPFAHGGVRGRSIATNLQAHCGNRYFYVVDIQDAFGSMKVEWVARLLYDRLWLLRQWPLEMTEAWLQQWCFLPDAGLITGAASAPMLFNMYIACTVGRHFTWYRQANGYWHKPPSDVTFTHYMDDIVFSSEWPISFQRRRELRELIWRAGFQLADQKTRYADLGEGSVEIAGATMDLNGRIFPSKELRRRAEGYLAAALAGKISPAVAHGHVGACLAALPGPHSERINRPEVAKIRTAQLRLLQERPLNPPQSGGVVESPLGPCTVELAYRSDPSWREPQGSVAQLPLF